MAQKTFADKAYVDAEVAKKANASHGTHVSYGGNGSATTVSRSDHTHNYAGSSSAGGAATSANKVNQNLAIKLNSGTTEGTNLFTFNGSTAKTIDITPSSIGAAASSHGTHLTLGTGSGNAFRGDYGNTAYTHSQAAHAPSNAQKNSDITKAEIEAKLTGTITSHNHSGTYAPATHGNHVPTIQTAQNNTFLRNDNTWQKVTPENIGAATASHGTHVTYGGNGSAATVSRSDHTHNYLPVSILTSNTDLNTLKTTGVYHLKSASNTNAAASGNATLYVDFNVGTPYQIFMHDATFKLYYRSYNSSASTWSAWSATLGNSISGNAATASSATKATQDSAGQQINTTYIKGLSVSGRTITYTKGDGTTGTITTQDSNTTYTADTGIKLNGTTFQHTNSVTAGTAQGDANKTLSWGGTFTIPTVTYDAQGHITAKGTTTMTMPANPNSDTKVTNTLNTTAKAYITGTTSSTTNTGTQVFDTGVYLDTTAGVLTAGTFKGKLTGNADSATKATQDSAGQQINTTYIKALSVSGKTITYTKGDGTTGTITTQDTNTDTHHQAKNIVGASTTATANATSSNGSTYLNLIENGAVRSTHKITGSGATTVSSDSSGNITISSTNTTYGVATTSANGLMSSSDKSKLDGIAAGANKYTHPSYTAKSSGFYKVTVDASGHVSATTAVAKSDIEGVLTGAVTSHTHSYIPMSGNTGAYSITGNLEFSDAGTSGGFKGVVGKCGTNDYWRVGGLGVASNDGRMEIATSDDANEPIYVRQYSGVYSTLVRSATLLDANGNTSFPGSVAVGDKVQMKYNSTSESLDFIFI